MSVLRRKKYVVSGQHLQFCLRILVLTMIPLLMVTLAALVVCFRLQALNDMSGLRQDPAAFAESIRNIAPHFILAFFIANVAAAWLTLLVYTNRVYGPIYQLEMKVKKVLSGEVSKLPRLSFRKDDEFGGLAELMNQMNYGSDSKAHRTVQKAFRPVYETKLSALNPTEEVMS